MNWQKFLKGKLKTNEHLSRHTSLKIGGPAQFLVEPKDLSDLQNVVNLAHREKITLWILGAGSNILVDDRGVKGIVVKLSSPYFKKITVNLAHSPEERNIRVRRCGVKKYIISAGAGLRLTRLIRCAQESGLSGFELLSGIPGTVGGALVMNAGDIGDRVLDITVMDKGARIKILKREEAQFGYRSSNLSKYIILSANFKLIKRDKDTIKKKINEYINYRRKTQDLAWPSAGCFFKNPSLDKLRVKPILCRKGPNSKSALRLRSGLMVSEVEPSAAYFIERCGLKGSSIGDAAVSSKHANYIINKGNASFTDTLRLMAYITRTVKKRFNLDLEPEIQIWK